MKAKKTVALVVAGVLIGLGLCLIPHTEPANVNGNVRWSRVGPAVANKDFTLHRGSILDYLCSGTDNFTSVSLTTREYGRPFTARLAPNDSCENPDSESTYPVSAVLNILLGVLIVLGVDKLIDKKRGQRA